MTLPGGAVVFVFLLVGSAGFPQGNHSRRVPQFVYGRWAITKFVEVGGHAAETKELAQAQMGKSLRIGVHSFDHDSNHELIGSVLPQAVKGERAVLTNRTPQ